MPEVRKRLARAGSEAGEQVRSVEIFRQRFLSDVFMQIYDSWPNKSPEPTPVGAYHFTRRFPSYYVAGPAWLSFFR